MLTFNRNKYGSFKIGTNHEQKGVGPRDFEKKNPRHKSRAGINSGKMLFGFTLNLH